MKRIPFFIFILLSIASYGQTLQLSDRAQIRLVTCGPGQEELYSAFGHSAYRVVDPIRNIDIIYNYGVFDFDQPNFYLNFARGFLNYKLAKHDYLQFRDYYIRANRSFVEQPLSLSPQQNQKLFEYLEWNSLPENQYYRYDYFYDNCATRIEYALSEALGDAVSFDYSFISESKSIRELTDDYLEYQPWGDLGIDICLGLPMDIEATSEMHLFLPDYVRDAFANATVSYEDGTRPLVGVTIDTYVARPAEIEESFFSPSQIFWGLFILGTILSFLDIIKGQRKTWLDVTLFSVVGLMGIFLFLLWFATDHAAAANNLNILWALPFHLVGVFLLFKKNKWTPLYFKLSTLWYLVLGALWFFLPQDLHHSLFPLALLLVVRSFISWKHSVKYGA